MGKVATDSNLALEECLVFLLRVAGGDHAALVTHTVTVAFGFFLALCTPW